MVMLPVSSAYIAKLMLTKTLNVITALIFLYKHFALLALNIKEFVF